MATKTTGIIPIDQTDPQAMSGIATPNQTADTSGFAGPVVAVAQPTQQSTGGTKGSGGWSGNFHADDVIGDEYVNLNPDQTVWIRNELNRRGLNEKSDPKEFRAGLKALGQEVPGLAKKSKAAALFSDDASATPVDPLAQQMFFFKTVAPYLEHIRGQTSQVTAPLYAHAQEMLPAAYKGQMAPFLTAMQAGDQNLQSALSGAVASAPALDALMQNVTAARHAANQAYFAAQNPGLGSGGMDLQSLMTAITGKPAGG